METKLEIKAALQARFRRTKIPGNRGQSMSALIMANQPVATPAAAGKKMKSTNVESSESEEDSSESDKSSSDRESDESTTEKETPVKQKTLQEQLQHSATKASENTANSKGIQKAQNMLQNLLCADNITDERKVIAMARLMQIGNIDDSEKSIFSAIKLNRAVVDDMYTHEKHSKEVKQVI